MTTAPLPASASGLPKYEMPHDPEIAEALALFGMLSPEAQEAFLELMRQGVTLPATPEGNAGFNRLCDEAKAKREARS